MTIEDLLGVWRRTACRWPDGREDTSTSVFWLQGRRFYADIRIPSDRPSFDGIDSLEQCTPEQRAWLATRQGFAGELVRSGDAFQWIREIDCQPPGGPLDIGRLRFVGSSQDEIIEEGVVPLH